MLGGLRRLGAVLLSLAACRTPTAPAATRPAVASDRSPAGSPPPPPGSAALSPPARPLSPPARPLRGPFDVEGQRARIGVALPPPLAPPPVAPVRDVLGVSFYVDESKSIADPALKAQNVAALAPLRHFVAAVTQLSDGWMRSRPADPRYARLAVQRLAAWAAGGALLGTVNQQGGYEREWTLGSLALAYLKIREAPGLEPPARATIEGWLCALASAVRPPYERMDRRSSANNHAYWTGLAVAAAGTACQDRGLFDWGIARARIGVDQINADGLLPLELARQRLALHYHLFALAPLVMLAELAAANGIALYDEKDHALRRLADRVIAGLAEPARFESLTGFAQEQITQPPRQTDLAWAEPYAARFPNATLGRWLADARPVVDVRLGGDLTAAFARPTADVQVVP